MLFNQLVRLLGQICVLGLIILGPWRNGGLDSSTVQIFTYFSVASCVCALLTLWTTPIRERQKNSYVPTLIVAIPLFIGLALSIFQVVPLSDKALAHFSPHILELKQILLPPDSVLTLDQIANNELQSVSIDPELEQRNREFLDNAFQKPLADNFDLKKALLLDSALQNEFVSQKTEINKTPKWGTCISVYPAATRQAIIPFWCALIVFLSSSILFNTARSRSFLLKYIIIFGFFYALLCIITRVNPSALHTGVLKRLFGKWYPDGSYGFFQNKNACAGYLVLLLSVGITLTASEFLKSAFWVNKERKSRHIHNKSAHERDYEVTQTSSWKLLLGDFFDLFNKRLLLWLVMTAGIFSAILISLSRGASIAASIVLVVVGCISLLLRKETRRYWFVLFVPVILTLSVLLSTNAYNSVDERMSTLVEKDDAGLTAIEQDTRWDNWRGALESSKNYVWFGSGLGTYFLANRSNDVALKHHKLFYYAENVFVQTLLEFGYIGLGLLIIEYVLLFIFLGRLLRGRHSYEAFALSLGAIALVIGQIISSCCDFNNYLPTNLILFAILCGVCLGRPNLKQWEELTSHLGDKNRAPKATRKLEELRKQEKKGLIVLSLSILICLSGSTVVFKENSDAVTRERLLAFAATITDSKLPYMSESGLDGIINEFEEFLQKRDDSYEIRDELASLYIKKFRLSILPYIGEQFKTSAEQLWKETEVQKQLAIMLRAQSINLKIPVRKLRSDPNVLANLLPSTHNYYVSRSICPLFVDSNRMIMKTLPLTTNLSWEEEQTLMELYCRRDISFTPWDSYELFKNGSYLSIYKLSDLQQECFNRTFKYTSLYTDLILSMLDSSPNISNINETVYNTLPNSPYIVFEIFQRACVSFKNKPIYEVIEKRFEEILAGIPENERDIRFYYWNAVLKEHQRKFEDADEAYLKALEIEPYNSFYCLRRAKFLIKYRNILDKDEECLQFLENIHTQMRGPNRWEAERLLEISKKNVMDLRARRRAQERIRREREMNKRALEESQTTTSSRKNVISVDEDNVTEN